MNFFQGFSKGIKAYGKAVRLLSSEYFGYFLLFPIFIIVVLFVAGNYTVSCIGGEFAETVEQQVMEWLTEISWLNWLSGLAGFIVRLLVKALYYILFISFGGYVVMVVMSPVYSWLSERTEAHLSGKKYPFNFGQLMLEMGRGIVISLRCMIFQFILTMILFILSFIPLVGLVTPVLTFGVSAYFYGFAFMDYAVERKRFRVKESVRYMRHNAGMVVAIGAVFALVLMIPFIRIIVCSFVSLLSVIAGTVVVDESLNRRNEK